MSFPPDKIRNVALVGHGGSGKTTLAEALLAHRRRDQPARDGSRTAPRSATSIPRSRREASRCRWPSRPFEWKGHKVNLIDTPGYADFVGDVAGALRVADLAVFVVSAVEGVEVQTEVLWRRRSRARPAPDGLRQQARPRAGRLRAHARRAEGPLRRRHRPARAADRRGGGVPRRRRPAHRHRVALRRRRHRHRGEIPEDMEALEHAGARQPRRGHRRRRRRPHGALPRRRRALLRGARADARGRRGRSDRVPGGVRLGARPRSASTGWPTSSARSDRRPLDRPRSRSRPATPRPR